MFFGFGPGLFLFNSRFCNFSAISKTLSSPSGRPVRHAFENPQPHHFAHSIGSFSNPRLTRKADPLSQFHPDPCQINGRLEFYSIFCTCSRICSINTFSSTEAAVVSASADLELRVFASRLNSCMMKSRRRPMASLRCRVSLVAST